MYKRMLVLLVGAVLLAGLAFAHGDEQHVTELSARSRDNTISVEVAPKQGETQKTTVTVNVISSTKFRENRCHCHNQGPQGWVIVSSSTLAKKTASSKRTSSTIGMAMDGMKHE